MNNNELDTHSILWMAIFDSEIIALTYGDFSLLHLKTYRK